ncbi:MAG TPA: hypothetical protein PKN48_14905 [Bacteroidales bacterium]|nr:hypothetical protein [Bacteroidales bacterium]
MKPKPVIIEDDYNTPPPTVVEEMPEFPGGEAARINFCQKTSNIPRQQAR